MELLIPVDRDRERPLRDQVYDGLRSAILDGTLGAGARLPSTRALAHHLGLSRFTIADAYNRLMTEGYLAGQVGSGTFVAPSLPAPDPVTSLRPVTLALDEPRPQRAWSGWSDRLNALAPQQDAAPPAEIDFRHALPDLSTFPHAVWRRLLTRAARRPSHATAYYQPGAGIPELRTAIASYLNRSRSVPCTSDQIIITSGSQDAVDLLARVWIDPGDRVIVEEPGYARARTTFELAGAGIVPMPVDREGLCIDQMAAIDAKAVYVTPSHHYPTGAVLSLARRMALLAWARRHNALIVEDDYNSEFRYGARPIPALAGLDQERASVAYVGTFSKVLYPSMRIGYLVLPVDMVERVVAAKIATNRSVPYLEQAVLADFIQESHFERHLSRVRKLYARRQAALIAALRDELGDIAQLDPAGTSAGLHLLVSFNVPWSSPEIVSRARSVGVHLDDADGCYIATPPDRPTFMLGYACLDEPLMREGLRRVRAILR